MDEWDIECIGRFIYSARRYGAEMADVERWMANDLEVACPAADDDKAKAELYRAFVEKYRRSDEIQENYARFMESLEGGAASFRGALLRS